MKRALVLGIVVVLAVLVSNVVQAQSNPAFGTWKMNTEKSKYIPGPMPQSLTQTEEAAGDGVKGGAEGIAADGTHFAWSYTANYDGKDNPISGTGAPSGADTIAVKRSAAMPNYTEARFKKDGKVVMLGQTVVSADGKTKTITAKGTDPNGKSVRRKIVFDKQ
jgi:hypothetical protein